MPTLKIRLLPILPFFAAIVAAQPAKILSAGQSSPAKPLTVERIVAPSNPNGYLLQSLRWKPDSAKLTFVQAKQINPKNPKAQPPDEIWSIDAATGERRILLSSEQLAAVLVREKPMTFGSGDDEKTLDPAKLRDYLWAPNNHALLLITDLSLVWFDLESGNARKLVFGDDELSSVSIAPDGAHISFVRNHSLWILDAQTGKVDAATPAGSEDLREGELDWPCQNELGLKTAYWWSPDSTRLAYAQIDDRAVAKYVLRSAGGEDHPIAYPKPGGGIPIVRLFVKSLQSKTAQPVEIDLGADKNVYIPRVQWLPDGKHLAVERLNRTQKMLELLIADSSTGNARVVLTEKDDYWINLSDGPHFLKDSHRFLWSSERTGYRHLYLYDIDGRQLAQLTHGDWEVSTFAGVDESTGSVYFTSTEKSPLERQLDRISLDGTGFRPITQENGTHEASFSPDMHSFVDTYSSRASPPRQNLLRADGTGIAAINKGAEADLHLQPVDFLTVTAHMGQKLNAFMIKPPGFDPAKQYPVIFYYAGGPGEQIVRDMWGGANILWLQSMAQQGYIIFALDNQGTAGRGHIFEEPLHYRFSAQELVDQRDGSRYIRSLPYVDKTRLGIFGWGYGGFLAVHAMLDIPIPYKAAIAGAPICDWHFYDAIFGERYLGDPELYADGWNGSSPLENAKNLKSPLLIPQGTQDEKVHIENSLSLLRELLENSKYADLLLFPDRGHTFEDPQSRLILYRRMTDFFLKNL